MGLLNLLEITHHVFHRRSTNIIIDFETPDLLDLQEGIQQEHRGGMQMNEAAGKAAGQLAVHRLDELSIKIRRIYRGRIFLHPNDRTGRPQGILTVEIATVKERDGLPVFLRELTEDVPEPLEQLRGPVGFIGKVENALAMPAQYRVQIGGPQICGVADRKQTSGSRRQRLAKFHDTF